MDLLPVPEAGLSWVSVVRIRFRIFNYQWRDSGVVCFKILRESLGHLLEGLPEVRAAQVEPGALREGHPP